MNDAKIINDPVFGFIKIPRGLLLDIVKHPLMQRLSRIRQLGMASVVYPGAQHTRFQHSLGAFYLMSEAGYTLLPDPDKLSYSFASDGTVYSSAASYLRVDASYDDTCNPAAHFRMSVGNLYISVRGLELLGSALANRGVVNGVQLLSPGSVRLMQMDQSALPGSSVTGASPYGLNTFRYDLLGHTWYGHQGWWSGRLVDLFYEPESHTSVVLVMNGSERTVGTVNREVAAQMERTLTYVTPWVDEALSDMTILDEDWE